MNAEGEDDREAQVAALDRSLGASHRDNRSTSARRNPEG
jgi:hypothetical protein